MRATGAIAGALVATLVATARAQVTDVAAPQLCHDDFVCKLLGGSCITGPTSDMVCGKEFLFNRFCGASDDCSCCVRASCEQTRWCSWYGGKCTGERECPSTHRWVRRLCGHNPFLESNHCGCCIPINPPTASPTAQPTNKPTGSPTPQPTPAPTSCTETDQCKIHGGKCTSIDECTQPKWDPTLCDFSATTFDPNGLRCGCCYGEPEPCPQTDRCKLSGGFCTKDSTDCPAGSMPNPDLCEGPDCMCCVPATVAPSPFTCQQSTECKVLDGFCTSDAAACPADFKKDDAICEGSECFCCFPERTEPPTSSQQCGPSEKCELNNGFCSREPECPSGMARNPDLCEGNDPNCACCLPITNPPSTSQECGPSEQCALVNGFCSREPECPSGMDRKTDLCEGTDPNCACCVPSA